MSGSPNKLSISGSLVRDGSFAMQQNPRQNKSRQQGQQRRQNNRKRASPAMSQPTKASQVSHPTGTQVPSGLTQGTHNLSHVQKKPRLDVRLESNLQHCGTQQLQQKQNSMRLQDHNPQSKDLSHQQRQQFLQSVPQMQRGHLQQHHQQLNHHRQEQDMQQVLAVKDTYDSALFSRRLLDYMHHQRQRPPDNSIAYWREFVAEYYHPRAKESWCFSLCNDMGDCALGVCGDGNTDAWDCEICCSKSGRGIEAIFETLPRLLQIKFDSGVIDELLFVDLPHGHKFPFGIFMLEYGKAVQRSVYKKFHVVREGQLHLVFTEELKILSWKFCARRYEEFWPRTLLAPLVNNLVDVSEKFQSPDTGNKSDGNPVQDLPTKCYMLQDAVSQLATNLEFSTRNDLGFSKTNLCCFKLSEVADTMKDLMDFSKQHELGPIGSLQNYPQPSSPAAEQLPEMEQQVSAWGPLTNHNIPNNAMAMHPVLNSNENNNYCHMIVGGQNANGIVGDGVSGGVNITSTGALPVNAWGLGLVGNGLGFGNSTAATSLQNGPTVLNQSNSLEVTDDGFFSVCGNNNQSIP